MKGRSDCQKCKGEGFVLVNEFIGSLQGFKDCECTALLDCPTCGKVVDCRDLGEVFSHGLPVPDRKGEYYCMTEEETKDLCEDLLKDVAPGRRINTLS